MAGALWDSDDNDEDRGGTGGRPRASASTGINQAAGAPPQQSAVRVRSWLGTRTTAAGFEHSTDDGIMCFPGAVKGPDRCAAGKGYD
jgi:hypothetical protein